MPAKAPRLGSAAIVQTLGPLRGLHLLDFNADQGDLIDLVAHEAASWK